MLYIIATPIGNRKDITLRALETLKSVDYVLAEDTRKTGALLKHYDIHDTKIISFFEHNEQRKIPQIVRDLQQGVNIALASSAGTPTISDPGYKLVCECRRQGIDVTSIPGPSSVITALSLTSLAHEQFMFLGYTPRKQAARRKLFTTLSSLATTFVFLESPYRLEKTLVDVAEVFSQKRIAVVRELTKKFEEVIECRAAEYKKILAKKPRGEYLIVIENR